MEEQQEHSATQSFPRHSLGGHKWKQRRQLSLDRTSMSSINTSTSNTDSTFDEVESLDLGGSQDLEFGIPQLSRGLTYEDLQQLNRRLVESASCTPHWPESINTKHIEDSDVTSDDSSHSKSDAEHRNHRRRTLIIEEEEEELPFSPYVFNKKKVNKQTRKAKSASQQSSQDLPEFGDRGSLYEQLIDFKKSPSMSESSGTTSLNMSLEHLVRSPFESDYEYQLRLMRRTSRSSAGASGMLSRGVSFESTSSSFSNGSGPSEPIYPGSISAWPSAVPPQIPTAEDVLVSLGFCGTDSFIPERFARDWYQKTFQRHQKRVVFEKEPQLRSRDLDGVGHEMLPTSMQPVSGRGRRSRLRRAATVLTLHQGALKMQNLHKIKEFKEQKTSPLSRQSSMEQLRSTLEKQASILQQQHQQQQQQQQQQQELHSDTSGMVDKRRKVFSRQKSLPLRLDTLSEEEEGRLSGGPSIEKGRDLTGNVVKMRTFLEQEHMHHGSSESDHSQPVSSPRKYSSSSSVLPPSTNTSLESDQESFSFPEDGEHTTVLFQPKADEASNSRPPLCSVPSIVVSRLTTQSSSSLEIADIMDANSPHIHKGGRLMIEPAMISTDILSSDNDESRSGTSSRRSSINTGESLSLPSLSPIPLSPVTVIEVDQLDNQNDSLDSGDSASETREGVDTELMKPDISLQPISEEEMMSSDASRSASFDAESVENSPWRCRSPNDTRRFFVGADNGRLSPLISPPGVHHLLLPHSKPNSESAYESSDDDYISESDIVSDAQVQADDGMLSPIVMLYPPSGVSNSPIPLPDNLCWVTDTGMQASADDLYDSNDSHSGQLLGETHRCETSTQTPVWGCTTQWSVSTVNSEGEPSMQYYTSESCQTDAYVNLMPQSFEHICDGFKWSGGRNKISTDHMASVNNCSMKTEASIPENSIDMPPVSHPSSVETEHERRKGHIIQGGRKPLDTIIERLSKKIDQVQRRVRYRTDFYAYISHGGGIESRTNHRTTMQMQISANPGGKHQNDQHIDTAKPKSFADKDQQSNCQMSGTGEAVGSYDNSHSSVEEPNGNAITERSLNDDLEEQILDAGVDCKTSACDSVEREVSSVKEHLGVPGRRSSLQRQAPMDVPSVNSSPCEFAFRSSNQRSNSINLSPPPEEQMSISPAHEGLDVITRTDHSNNNLGANLNRNVGSCENSSLSSKNINRKKIASSFLEESSLGTSIEEVFSPMSSMEKDRLATSIVTDLFQGIQTGVTSRTAGSGRDTQQVLRDIELDYQVLQAVNRTVHRLLSGELSGESSVSHPQFDAQLNLF